MGARLGSLNDCDRTRITPPTFQALANYFTMPIVLSGPFHQRFCFTVYREVVAGSSITSLLRRCGPSHIADFIMSVYIFAIQRMACGRTIAYFFKKFLKRLKAKLNPSAAVVGISRIIRIIATFSSIVKCNTFGRVTHSVGAVHLASYFFLQTSAGLRLPVTQIPCAYFSNLTARAGTPPYWVIVLRGIACISKNRQSTVLHACTVNKLCVGRNRGKGKSHNG